MVVRRNRIAREAIRSELAQNIQYTDLASKTIEMWIPITLIGSDQSVAADSTGDKLISHSGFDFNNFANIVKHVKAAKFAFDYTWADTADGTIRLKDIRNGTVVAESSTKTGGESSVWEVVDCDISKLVSDASLYVYVNISSAGASGETVTVRRAYLVLKIEIS